jgi:hypothetical protein
MADWVLIPIAGIGTLVLDLEAYQSALQPLAAPLPQIKNEQFLLVDTAKMGEMTSTAGS